MKILCAAGNVAHGQVVGDPFLRMDGQAVFKLAVTSLTKAAIDVCEQAGMQLADVDWLVPHQAKVRIIKFLSKRLGNPDEKVVITVEDRKSTRLNSSH